MENTNRGFTITDGAMCLIENVVVKNNLTEKDRMQILDAVCNVLEEKYQGDAMEFHLKRMHLSTTAEILRTIDIYFIMRDEFPDYSFRGSIRSKSAQKAAV